MLRIKGVQEVCEALCIVDIDPYVPISFKSRSQPIAGARYIRLGDFKTTLLELQFPPESLAVSGFTLVSGEGAAQAGLEGDGPSAAGLPIVCLPQGEAFSNNARIPRLDIKTDVVLSCADGRADVKLGASETFNRTVTHGRVQFLILDDLLVGLRVLDLTESERRILRDYVAEHPMQETSAGQDKA
jgi:hypothetical protein